eukprot:8965487-Pyramimonas_sp.AAC.1
MSTTQGARGWRAKPCSLKAVRSQKTSAPAWRIGNKPKNSCPQFNHRQLGPSPRMPPAGGRQTEVLPAYF